MSIRTPVLGNNPLELIVQLFNLGPQPLHIIFGHITPSTTYVCETSGLACH